MCVSLSADSVDNAIPSVIKSDIFCNMNALKVDIVALHWIADCSFPCLWNQTWHFDMLKPVRFVKKVCRECSLIIKAVHCTFY